MYVRQHRCASGKIHPLPTLVFDGVVPKAGAVFGWLMIPQQLASSGMPAASLSVTLPDSDGSVTATVTVGGRDEAVVLQLGPAPAPPPTPAPCLPGMFRICGACRPVALACPNGTSLDVVLLSGDDGSCNCEEYCATDWNGQLKTQRPQWGGATSLFGNSTAPVGCDPPICACVQATHWCARIEHECKLGCGSTGVPAPRDFCRRV